MNLLKTTPPNIACAILFTCSSFGSDQVIRELGSAQIEEGGLAPHHVLTCSAITVDPNTEKPIKSIAEELVMRPFQPRAGIRSGDSVTLSIRTFDRGCSVFTASSENNALLNAVSFPTILTFSSYFKKRSHNLFVLTYVHTSSEKLSSPQTYQGFATTTPEGTAPEYRSYQKLLSPSKDDSGDNYNE